jgi:hypothetical protein
LALFGLRLAGGTSAIISREQKSVITKALPTASLPYSQHAVVSFTKLETIFSQPSPQPNPNPFSRDHRVSEPCSVYEMLKNYLGRQRTKFEATLAFSMLEPWEKILCSKYIHPLLPKWALGVPVSSHVSSSYGNLTESLQ